MKTGDWDTSKARGHESSGEGPIDDVIGSAPIGGLKNARFDRAAVSRYHK
jgi:hypothetical protein